LIASAGPTAKYLFVVYCASTRNCGGDGAQDPVYGKPFCHRWGTPPTPQRGVLRGPKGLGSVPEKQTPGFEERPGYPTRVAPDRGWHLV